MDTADRSPLRRRAALALVLLFAFYTRVFADELALSLQGDRHDFNIPAGPASEMLDRFSAQTLIGIMSESETLANLSTHAVIGLHTPLEALQEMLKGTGLSFHIINAHMITVVKDEPTQLAAASEISVRPESPNRHSGSRSTDTPQQTIEQVLIRSRLYSRDYITVGIEPLFSFNRVDLDRPSAQTASDLLKSLPQVFGGGPTEDTHLGAEAATNFMNGSGINLRGLGAANTLVLIDGRRIAPSGSSGLFVDISNIPLSAVERIDILPSAAATPYGADAPGGVVNFVMRRNFVGHELRVSVGDTTDGIMREHRYDLLTGTRLTAWDRPGNAVLSLEYFDRGALAAADRAQATSDLRRWGGADFDTPYGNPGTIVIGSQSWAIPRGQSGQDLSAAELLPGTNGYDRYEGATILPEQKRLSALVAAHYWPNDHLEVSLNALGSKRWVTARSSAATANLLVPATNPYYINPTGHSDPIIIEYGFGADLGPMTLRGSAKTANTGLSLEWQYPKWRARVYAGYTSETAGEYTSGLVNLPALETALADPNRSTTFNPFGDGSHTNPATLERIRDYNSFDTDSTLTTGGFSLQRALPGVGAGDLNLSIGAEYCRQLFSSLARPSSSLPDLQERLHRSTRSIFAELSIPLFSDVRRWPALERLEASAAARIDEYSDVGRSVTPTFGLTWSPVSSLALRGTYNRSFRAPPLPDLVESINQAIPVNLPDPFPGSPSHTTRTLAWVGNNAELVAESASTRTVGVTFTPKSLENLSLAITYFDVSFERRIDQPELRLDALSNPAFADRLTRNPSAALLNEVCHRSPYGSSSASCPGSYGSVGALLDLRMRNLAILKTQGIDLAATTDGRIGRSAAGLRLDATYLFEFAQAAGPRAPLVNLLSAQNQPINFRLRGAGYLRYRGWELSTLLTYANHYRDTVSDRSIGSWTTTDLGLSYELRSARLGPLSRIKLSVNAQNVFDRYPPFLNNAQTWIGYDQENGDLVGRFISVAISAAH